jgi:hypothetical protein
MKSPLLLLSCSLPGLLGAAPFQNLGFDELNFPDFFPAPIPGPPFDGAPEKWVTPGWNVPNGVGYNYPQRFEGYSSILDASYVNTTQPANPNKLPVVGSFSLGIWPSSSPETFTGLPPKFVLRQTGDIPAEAQSLRFLYHGNDLTVSVGGASALVHFLEDRPSGNPDVPLFHYFAVDVGLWAGKTAELKFEFRSFGNYPDHDGGSIPGWPDATMHVLDDLSFSPFPAIPEPFSWALFGFGAVALFCMSQRKS